MYLSYRSFSECQPNFSRMLGRKFFGWKKIHCKIWLWANDFQATVPEETFGGKKIFSNRMIFPSISAFQLMILGLLAKNRKGHQNCILLVQRKFLARNYFWEKKIITFAIAAEKAQTFYRIFCHRCQIFLPRVQKKELLREQKFEKQENSIHFSSLRERVSKLCKSFQQILQNCVLPIQSINSRKYFSWNVM